MNGPHARIFHLLMKVSVPFAIFMDYISHAPVHVPDIDIFGTVDADSENVSANKSSGSTAKYCSWPHKGELAVEGEAKRIPGQMVSPMESTINAGSASEPQSTMWRVLPLFASIAINRSGMRACTYSIPT